MNVNKRNNYQLTGSIHTLSLVSLPVTDIDESIAPVLTLCPAEKTYPTAK